MEINYASMITPCPVGGFNVMSINGIIHFNNYKKALDFVNKKEPKYPDSVVDPIFLKDSM